MRNYKLKIMKFPDFFRGKGKIVPLLN